MLFSGGKVEAKPAYIETSVLTTQQWDLPLVRCAGYYGMSSTISEQWQRLAADPGTAISAAIQEGIGKRKEHQPLILTRSDIRVTFCQWNIDLGTRCQEIFPPQLAPKEPQGRKNESIIALYIELAGVYPDYGVPLLIQIEFYILRDFRQVCMPMPPKLRCNIGLNVSHGVPCK